MKRDRVAVLFFAVGVLALFALCFVAMARWRVHQAAQGGDQLQWLRTEYKLSDAEMDRIRTLHEGYLPKCEALCARIAATTREAEAEMATATTVTPAVAAKLKEAADLHAECQAQMLAHFFEVSRAMPPEQGSRYLEEMKRFVLDGAGMAGHESTQRDLQGAPHAHH